jgi:DNA invertase Pin-like site-specific DNA recombinase
MIIGYARTSTTQQNAGFESQIVELKKAGCEKVFKEQVSAVKERDQLNAAIDFVREGDTFVATKLDRIARSVTHLLQIVESLKKKGVTLRILNIGLDTSNPTGKLMLTMLGAIAEFEREMMLERQLEGIAAAKAQGKYKGRKPTARAKAADVMKLAGEGVTKEEIARSLQIGIASVYRILSENKRSSTDKAFV